MSLVLLLALAAECDSVPAAPKIPLPTEFQCPLGATAEPHPPNGVECVARDGKTTGDTFALDGKTGLMVHPLGLSLAWNERGISWWHQRPTGHRVAYDGTRPTRVEHFVGGNLACARVFENGRLTRRFDDGKWTWLDLKGGAIDLKVPLERSEIASVVREHQPEVQLCYEARLHEVKGDFHGSVSVTVEIDGGDVKSAKVSEDTLHDPPVSDCLAARVLGWKFRPSSEAVDVTFPFVFKERR